MSDQERKCRFISTVHQAGPTLASVAGRDGGDRTWVAIVLCARASMQVDRAWAASCSCSAHAWDVQNVYESFGTVGACLQLTAALEVPGPGWLDVGPHSAPTDVIPSSAGSYGRNASYLVDVDLVQQDTSTPKTLYSHTSLGHCAAEPPHTFCCRLHSTLPADQHTGPRY